MYKTYRYEKTISLWCDGRVEGVPENSCAKRGNSSDNSDRPNSKRARREEEIDSIFEQLRNKHSENYSDPQLRLWARMQVNGHHSDLDSPPNVPAITGHSQTRRKKEPPLTEALTGCATAITKVLMKSQESCEPPVPCTPPSCKKPSSDGISPASKAKLSGQYLQQLNLLQQLRDNVTLTEQEFQEQKKILLNNIKGINSN